jgi:mRNA-degrading endonuclease toxin of MazEF toxin-antitoxin module
VSQIVTLDRGVLTERAGRLSPSSLELVLAGIDVVLGRG